MEFKRKIRVDVDIYEINFAFKHTTICLGEYDKVSEFAKIRDNMVKSNFNCSLMFNVSEVIYDENGEVKIIENH